MERTHPIFRPWLPAPLQLGMLLFAIVTTLVISCFVLASANQYPLTLLGFVVSDPLAALVGGLIIARQPRNWVGWCIVGHAFCFTLAELSRQYALYGGITSPGSLPFAHEIAWFCYWLWGPGILFGFILLPLYFPNGRLVSPRWRIVLWYAVLTSTLATVTMAFSPGDFETPGIPNPLGFLPTSRIESWYGIFTQITWLAGSVLAVASMVVRFRQSDAKEKQQVKWIFYAMLIMVVFLFTPITGLLSEITGSLAIAGLWVAIGIGVLRYRLYNIDIIINRTLVYIALTAIIATAYVATVGLLSTYISSGDNLVNALIAVGLITVIFQPLRERLQRSVNRLLYGERDEPYTVLTRLGRRLEETLAPDQALPTIVETMATALKLPYAAIALGEGKMLTVVAEYRRIPLPEMQLETQLEMQPETAVANASDSSMAQNNLVYLPLVHQRQQLGELRLGLRPGEQAFGPADERLLNELARQIGVAVSSAQLTHALQQAREQLIMAREEERRRLRRDLHDGLGPVLAAQRLKLGSARYFLNQDPAVADRLLAEQEHDIEAALQDVRRLVDNLRPPALDDLGLAVAIQRIAAQYGITGDGVADSARRKDGTSLKIRVEVPASLPPLPAAVEVACYRIVQEALTNVVRHAQASRCHVTLTVVDRAGKKKVQPGATHGDMHGDRSLLLVVSDDGRGLEKAASTTVGSGLGLHSMRARAEELGGTMTVGPNKRKGTVVRVQLPIPTAYEGVDGRKMQISQRTSEQTSSE